MGNPQFSMGDLPPTLDHLGLEISGFLHLPKPIVRVLQAPKA